MKTISKYTIQTDEKQISIPSESILSAEYLNGEIVMYALTDTDDMMERPYEIRVFEAGQEIDIETGSFNFLGSVGINGRSTLHVFYKSLSSVDF